MKNSPIIIIGAGRSGTNILRDCICKIDGFETWPCDEINYIWRHGNISKKDDRFTKKEANNKAVKYIKKEFEHFESSSKAEYVVEKTCASSLKVPFIHEIFPDAKFVFIIRDGKDVASSAKQRWTASLELKYIWKKVKYVPLADIPHYGFRYFINRVKKVFSKEKRLAYWGPIYPTMMEDLKKDSLIEICAKQWSACVEFAYNDLKELDKKNVHMLRYENFVTNPSDELNKIFNFLNIEISNDAIQNAVKKVSPKSIHNFEKYLTKDEIQKMESIVQPTMDKIYSTIP